jgi:hypothetical protein
VESNTSVDLSLTPATPQTVASAAGPGLFRPGFHGFWGVKEMFTQRLIPALFLLSFIAAPASAFEMKPGEWEVETKMQGMPEGFAVPKTKICVTPDKANVERMKEKGKETGCEVKILEKRSDFISYESVCKNQGSSTKGSVKRISDNEIVTDNTVTMDLGSGKQTTQVTARQKFINSTCSKEALGNVPK